MAKSATISLNVDADLVAQAQERGINLDDLLQRALIRAVALGSERDERAKAWARENAAAIESWNNDVRERGLWCDDLRQF